MQLTSPLFLSVALPILVCGCLIVRTDLIKPLLLFASLLLYAWGEPRAILVLVGLALLNFGLGLAVGSRSAYRKVFLTVGIMLNLASLCLFKYAFFWGSLLEAGNQLVSLLLPMGMSYYVFQLVSYLIDVFRGKHKAERSFLNFLLFAGFFSKMTCGPIVRYEDFDNGLKDCRIRVENFVEGMRRFGIGLGKKVLISDMVARIVDPIFSSPVETIPCVYCWVGAIAYTIQIYFDFSGYSDMAIGLARVFGFRFSENFDHPYGARSVQEFWRRWHISLSTWFRDYLYIPLGGNRKGLLRTYANQFVVFALCGVWHGASWTFLAWGVYHGLGLTLEKAGLKKVLEKGPVCLANAYALLFVMVGWVLFRSDSFSFAGGFLKQMFFGNSSAPYWTFTKSLWFFDYSGITLLLIGGALSYSGLCSKLESMDRRLRMIPSAVLLLLAVLFSITGTFSPGIYGKF